MFAENNRLTKNEPQTIRRGGKLTFVWFFVYGF